MKTSRNSKRPEPDGPKQRSEATEPRALVGRLGLAAALGVSLRTVDRMLAAGEIVPVRMRGWSVRFYLPDVVECLRRGDRKWGRKADLTTEIAESTEKPAKGQSQIPDFKFQRGAKAERTPAA